MHNYRVTDAERLETDLGGGFIHEVTNAITIVMGQCFLLQLDETVSPGVRARLDAIAIAAERIAKVIHEYPNPAFRRTRSQADVDRTDRL